MAFKMSKDVGEKLLKDHDVVMKEVFECFGNGEAIYFEDIREGNKTNPPTWWFMAPTNKGRLLKVCFIRKDGDIEIKTAYEPDDDRPKNLYIQLAELPPSWPNEEC
jgi:hypothetical protein